jgi:5-formyltetrahydrofolate cyclo-ligase
VLSPSTSLHDTRNRLRAQMAERRNALDARQRVAAAAGVLRSLATLPEFLTGPHVAGYWAIRGELPLNAAEASVHRRGQQYFLPVLGPARQLGFADYAPGTPLTNNRYGIPEPTDAAGLQRSAREMDVILLPLLAFDRDGNRLGTGGGWYDTSLAFLHDRPRPATPLLVGVGYALQQVPAVPAEPWDVRLDCVATEEELIACNLSVPTRQ